MSTDVLPTYTPTDLVGALRQFGVERADVVLGLPELLVSGLSHGLRVALTAAAHESGQTEDKGRKSDR